MQFAELTQQEVEFVQLTRDTTESDLKQRREINSGDVLFVDQAPVRAAKEGRCLILDGVEKIERNVLPTINNLLENREMHLDDGSFMLSSDRYDELVQNGENVNGLLRVHPDFRVIALGLPVPPFPGSTLDPPLRSRFQARVIMPPSSNILLEELLINVPNLPIPMAKKIVTFVEGIRLVSEESDRSIPPFPTHSLITIGKILERCSMETDVIRIISRSYPYINPSMEEGAFDTSMVSILKKVVSTYLDGNTKGHTSHYTFPMENENNITDNDQLNFNIGNNVTLNCYGGTLKKNGNSINPINDADIVPLNCYSHILLDMLQDHSTNNDLLIVGPKGCGKSILCKFFASKLNYSPILFQMYKDMTARDLLQRRATDESGNTYWEPSPVVNAAINGDLVILDGLDRLSMDTLTALQRLIVDREVELFDGTRLVSSEVTTTEKNNSSSKVYQVHPSFRIVAIGCPPSISNPWMTEEVATWFRTSVLSSPSKRDTLQMIFQLYPETPKETVNKILEFSLILSNMTSKGHKDEDKRAIGMSKGLSLRQILRLARHMNSFPDTAETSLASRIDDMLMVSVLL
jgi:MoxR-like ATPase